MTTGPVPDVRPAAPVASRVVEGLVGLSEAQRAAILAGLDAPEPAKALRAAMVGLPTDLQAEVLRRAITHLRKQRLHFYWRGA